MTIHCVTGDDKVGIMTMPGHHLGLGSHENLYHDDSGPSCWSEEAWNWYHYNSGWSSGSEESCLLRQRWWSRIIMIPTFMMNISIPIMCMYSHLIHTHKMPARYILSSVWMRLSIFSQLSITQCMGLFVFSLPIQFTLVMIERIHTLSYHHHQIGSVCFQFTHSVYPCDDWENTYFVLSSSSNRKYELLSII